MGFKRYHLKTHAYNSKPRHPPLKTHVPASKKHAKEQKKYEKLLKPMYLPAEIAKKARAGGGHLLNLATSVEEACVTHALAQLRIARHERIEIETEIDFPVYRG